MLDITKIRKETDNLIELLGRRGKDLSAAIKEIKKLDENWRLLLAESEELKSRKNRVSNKIGELKREKKAAEDEMAAMKEISVSIKKLDEQIGEIKSRLNNKMLNIPNLPDENTPQKCKVIKEVGDIKKFDFLPLTHWEIGKILGILDFKVSAKLSGSRFAFLKGDGAELERALINFMLDIHKNKFGYTEVITPYLVKEEIMIGSGQLPKFKDEMYFTENEKLYLIPTAEVPLVNIHRLETIQKSQLPIKYVSATPCFRREAGSYGKDTSGLIRNHQFNKVELVNIVLPEDSEKFHKQLLEESEEILKLLNLTYRILELGAEDIGFSAARTYDFEVWMPGEKKWREVSSCSNCGDFQSRRMELRYRDANGTNYLHTLNSSGLAVGRIFAAILENYQNNEIKVKIPEVLIKYMSGKDIITQEPTLRARTETKKAGIYTSQKVKAY